MAKGDAGDVRSGVNQNLNSSLIPQQQYANQQFRNASQQAGGDYNSILGQYQNIASQFPDYFNTIRNAVGTIGSTPTPGFNSALAGYQDFSKTGGFSEQDLQNLRARGVSPIRSFYQNAQSNIDRQSELQGGYSPNKIAAEAQLSRQLPQQMSDAMQNVNGQIAQMVAQNKLAGLQGLGNLSSEQMQLALQAAMANSGTQLKLGEFGLEGQMAPLAGMRSLYGTTPGLAEMFGRQVLGTNSDINRAYGINAGLADSPGRFQSAMGNINSGTNTFGKLAQMLGVGTGGANGGNGGNSGSWNPFSRGGQQSGQLNDPNTFVGPRDPNGTYGGYSPDPYDGGSQYDGNFNYGSYGLPNFDSGGGNTPYSGDFNSEYGGYNSGSYDGSGWGF